MVRSESRVPTPSANRYAKRLCNHAAHMVSRLEWTPPYGVIGFPWAETCRIEAGPDELTRIREIVVGDLERFARRDGLEVSWSS